MRCARPVSATGLPVLAGCCANSDMPAPAISNSVVLRLLVATSIIGATSLRASTSHAQNVEEFYKRTAVSLYVGSGAGGGFDNYARIFAPHFRRHIPGTPSIVIKNMPGAAGITSMNFIQSTAPRDGS